MTGHGRTELERHLGEFSPSPVFGEDKKMKQGQSWEEASEDRRKLSQPLHLPDTRWDGQDKLPQSQLYPGKVRYRDVHPRRLEPCTPPSLRSDF